MIARTSRFTLIGLSKSPFFPTETLNAQCNMEWSGFTSLDICSCKIMERTWLIDLAKWDKGPFKIQ